MCLAQPRQVISVSGETALIRMGTRERVVSCAFAPDVQAGDYVIVAGDVIVERLDPVEAKARREIFGELEEYLGERV
jgi:hydrogenase maturation factor